MKKTICIPIVFDFSWDNCNTRRKWKQWLCEILGGKQDGGGRKGLRYCGIGFFWCGVAVIFISKYGIAVFRVQAVCGEFKFYVAVVGEKIVVSR